MEEWDQQLADSHSIETMRRIARDAMCFGDDDAAFYTCVDQHKLTVNEIVYYLNAYEAGGDDGWLLRWKRQRVRGKREHIV
jgi:hypothetical protein